ncbi:MAG TPA: hypothetical protein ENI64_00445 [Gammaproteobacteria bacterium]|nr:hypothetical protein [Gammaproteobacteria bacterium]
MPNKYFRTISALLLSAILGSFASAANAEEKTIQILAPWEGEGKMFQIGTETIQFVGTFEGVMYMDKSKNELSTAFFICPATQDINTTTGKTSASGYCYIVAQRGKVFAKFTCKGEAVGSCDGTMTITGGTDGLEGIKGSGPMHVRTAIGAVAANVNSGEIVRAAKGLVVWPKMKITLPKAKKK